MQTQINFRQNNPDKSAKYGMLFNSINSATYPYTYQGHVYCGKPKGEPNEFYISGTENYIQYLVNKLSSYHDITGRNILMDRLYSSLSVAKWLLDKGITMVGTMQKNRVGIPASLKDVTNGEINSTETYWEKNGKRIFTSHVTKTSKGKKNVIVLSTIEPLFGTTIDDDKCKPAKIKFYDFTKGGTDIIDQKMGYYTVKTK